MKGGTTLSPSARDKKKETAPRRNILLQLLALWPLWLTLFALGFGLGFLYFDRILALF